MGYLTQAETWNLVYHLSIRLGLGFLSKVPKPHIPPAPRRKQLCCCWFASICKNSFIVSQWSEQCPWECLYNSYYVPHTSDPKPEPLCPQVQPQTSVSWP